MIQNTAQSAEVGTFCRCWACVERIGSGVTERKKMETVRFDELDLYPQVLRAIADMGFEGNADSEPGDSGCDVGRGCDRTGTDRYR